VVGCLPSKRKALCSNPNTAKKRKEKEKNPGNENLEPTKTVPPKQASIKFSGSLSFSRVSKVLTQTPLHQWKGMIRNIRTEAMSSGGELFK
jgi:hypothetical protein